MDRAPLFFSSGKREIRERVPSGVSGYDLFQFASANLSASVFFFLASAPCHATLAVTTAKINSARSFIVVIPGFFCRF
jgi:hypothetical protein